VKPEFREYRGANPVAYVISLNLRRRHLDESQRAMVAARLANMRQGERTDKQPSANLQKVARADAATMLNVSTRSVSSARAVLDHGTDELKHAVDSGHLAVSVAAKAAELPKAQQREIVKQAEAGNANVVRNVVKKAARPGKLPEREKGQSRDKVAKATGKKARTLAKAEAVVVAALWTIAACDTPRLSVVVTMKITTSRTLAADCRPAVRCRARRQAVSAALRPGERRTTVRPSAPRPEGQAWDHPIRFCRGA